VLDATRRRFLKLAGVSAAAGPVAVKRAADDVIMRAAGASVGSGGVSYGPARLAPLAGADGPKEPSNYVPYEQKIIQASEYVRLVGVPAGLEEELRAQSRWVDRLDPDIASKVSWSMSYKFLVQRQRNYERALNDIRRAAGRQRARQLVKGLLGFEWPW
jgi:hypothetical protein